MKAVAYEPRLRRGESWNALPAQDLNPEAQQKQNCERLKQIDIPRLEKLSVATWPKLSARFGIGAGYIVDLATGAWTDRRTGHRGAGIISLIARIGRASFLEAAEALLRVIKVRRRQLTVEAKPDLVIEAAAAAEAGLASAPVQIAEKSKAAPRTSSVVMSNWLASLLPIIGRKPTPYTSPGVTRYAALAAVVAVASMVMGG